MNLNGWRDKAFSRNRVLNPDQNVVAGAAFIEAEVVI